MTDFAERLADIVGDAHVATGDAVGEDYRHDESLVIAPVTPAYLVRPGTAEQVAALLALATEAGVPVTARGSGTGLSGSAVPRADGMLVSFDRMNALVEIDTANQVAVVQPGLTLAELDTATAEHDLVYPVFPGELSGSLGGNVGTNAGGMRAVKYGVTRNNVLGLQAALPTGELIRSGGRIAKSSSGYDLTQLVIGSEGTLALTTEAVLKLHPRLAHSATVLAPFTDLDVVVRAVPKVIASGLEPYLCEYIDMLTMAAMTRSANLELGLPQQILDNTQAYLVVGVENRDGDRTEADVQTAGELLTELGATDVFVLDGPAARRLIEAREKAFYVSKAAGAHEVTDAVVPRAAMADYLAEVREAAARVGGAGVAGCGHAGDGNVHLAVFCADDAARAGLLHEIAALAVRMGGAISGEHGIGVAKREHYLALEDPAKLALMRRIKTAFDPAGILNPGVIF